MAPTSRPASEAQVALELAAMTAAADEAKRQRRWCLLSPPLLACNSNPSSFSSPTTLAFRHVEYLIQLMKAGTTPLRREWDATTSGQHVNYLTGDYCRASKPEPSHSGLTYTSGFYRSSSPPPAKLWVLSDRSTRGPKRD